jgi:hypothetical protein
VAVDLYSTALIAIVVVFTDVLCIRFHASSSILEAVAGIILGSVLSVRIEPWLDFLGTFGGLMKSFLETKNANIRHIVSPGMDQFPIFDRGGLPW